MNRRKFLATTATITSATVLGTLGACSRPKDQPNILWLTAEDMSPTLGCYGDDYAIRPTLIGSLRRECDTRAVLPMRRCARRRAQASSPACLPARWARSICAASCRCRRRSRAIPNICAKPAIIAPTMSKKIIILTRLIRSGMSPATQPTGASVPTANHFLAFLTS